MHIQTAPSITDGAVMLNVAKTDLILDVFIQSIPAGLQIYTIHILFLKIFSRF